MNQNGNVLDLQDVHVYYGAIHAVKGISLNLKKGEIVCLIGANGAGKSTTLNAISGLVRPKSGSITYCGEKIDKCPPHQIVKRGISQSPEGRRIFANLTVLENLELGAYLRRDSVGIKKDIQRVFELFPRLNERKKQKGGTLSGGEQQMLAIGRAIMSGPSLLLLDEPSLGLAPLLVKQIFQTIREINQLGTAILLVEQNAHMALQIAHRGYVMETGRIVLTDKSENLLQNSKVKEAYLGT
ncbi:MAG: ABC transporter ATP-binding protein [candidate division Zixibacteria bacterium]|nr:ABC transporter ATP-binding protein [candidate division Zixibacteria bacterium]